MKIWRGEGENEPKDVGREAEVSVIIYMQSFRNSDIPVAMGIPSKNITSWKSS